MLEEGGTRGREVSSMNRPFAFLFLAVAASISTTSVKASWIDRYDTPNSGYCETAPPGGPLGLYLCPENPKRSGAAPAGIEGTGSVTIPRQGNSFPYAKRAPSRKGEAARRIELYSSAYKLAWEQISSAERRAHPDISLRIHASIRRQLKQGEMDPRRIAFAAIKDSLVPDTPE